MAELDLDALEQAAREAGGGCWFSAGWTVGSRGFEVGDLKSRDRICSDATERCAEFIAAANPAAISELLDRLEAAEKERDVLKDKIERMEKQEPFDADSDVFRGAFEAALKAGNWPTTRKGDGYRSPSAQIAWRIAFSTVNRLKLYLAPGAQPSSSVPEGWKLVSIEPTEEMYNAGANHCDGCWSTAQAVWDAMLAVAPEAKP